VVSKGFISSVNSRARGIPASQEAPAPRSRPVRGFIGDLDQSLRCCSVPSLSSRRECGGDAATPKLTDGDWLSPAGNPTKMAGASQPRRATHGPAREHFPSVRAYLGGSFLLPSIPPFFPPAPRIGDSGPRKFLPNRKATLPARMMEERRWRGARSCVFSASLRAPPQKRTSGLPCRARPNPLLLYVILS
jgi:hypothetical protein